MGVDEHWLTVERSKNDRLRHESSVLLGDLRDMRRALGLPDAPRSQSPHEVFRECIAEVERILNQ